MRQSIIRFISSTLPSGAHNERVWKAHYYCENLLGSHRLPILTQVKTLTVYHVSNLFGTHSSVARGKAIQYGFLDLHTPKIRIFARLAEISRYESRSIPLHCQMKNVSVVQWIGHLPTKHEIEVRVLTGIPNGVLADQVYAQD